MRLALGLGLSDLAARGQGGGVQLINGILVMDNRPLTLDNRVMRLSNGN
jgi:hypothetical protein